MRACGILLHVSSLTSPYGIGTMGKPARDFIDFLKESGQTWWQILPLGHPGFGDSPYQCYSSLAGNPYLIDPDGLKEQQLLTDDEICEHAGLFSDGNVQFNTLHKTRLGFLGKAWNRFDKLNPEYVAFVERHAFWLDNYALFMVLRERFKGNSWQRWPKDIRTRQKKAMETILLEAGEKPDFWRFLQYQFFRQWEALKKYANQNGIAIIGDIPIYVSMDSSDVWAQPWLFSLDDALKPVLVSGCPPDMFSSDGQIWGSPVYKWEAHRKTGYAWWKERIRMSMSLYDVIRIDHFRGFDAYYAIPAHHKDGRKGKWIPGPGIKLFEDLKVTFGRMDIIAEDLGLMTPSLTRLLKKTGYPGMKILQYAFDGEPENPFLPYRFDKNCVVYTGTHDNSTLAGWYKSLKRYERQRVQQFLNARGCRKVCDNMIRTVLGSVADWAIIPMQDWLCLDDAAIMNRPSTVGGNWQWRMPEGVLTGVLKKRIRTLTETYGRYYKKETHHVYQ